MSRQYRRLSRFLGVSKKDLSSKGVYDRVVGSDSLLFFDPFLLPKVDIPEFKNGRSKILNYFSKPIKLIKLGFVKEASRLFYFSEKKGVGLGYGQGAENGSAIGPKMAKKLAATTKLLIDTGIDDPEIIELIGLFQEGFGADRLSDMSIFIIHDEILDYTARVTKELGINRLLLTSIRKSDGEKVKVPFSNGKPILFLPKLALRQLPTADERENIDSIVRVNDELRKKFNSLIGKNISNWTKQHALQVFRENPQALKQLVDRYKERDSEPYDTDLDECGYDRWVDDGIDFANNNSILLSSKFNSIQDVQDIVIKIIKKFKEGVEFNGWSKLFFDEQTGTKPRHESYAQSVFYIVAKSYCEANNLDLSPECNSGRGPVDFKISRGMSKVLVELKLTSNTSFLSGIKTQLPIYQSAENADIGIFLAIKTTKSNNQIENLQALEISEKRAGKPFPLYFVVDGNKQVSASKTR